MSTNLYSFLLLFFSLGLLSSCQHDPFVELPSGKENLQIVHLAHTRMNDNREFNRTMAAIDFKKYDVRLLGGDLALHTSADRTVMDSLDQIFDLDHENTLWALGNHDYDDLSLIEEFTGRPSYYASTIGPITFIVLDTQDSLSNFVGPQLDLIKAVTDTISESTHLVLLHHQLIWMYGNEELEPSIPMVSNGRLGDCFWCINPNNFYPDVYPLLLEVEKRGIEVLSIAGDLGFQVKSFQYQTPEGIDFLGSGMNLEAADNRALLLEYDFEDAALFWSFAFLEDL